MVLLLYSLEARLRSPAYFPLLRRCPAPSPLLSFRSAPQTDYAPPEIVQVLLSIQLPAWPAFPGGRELPGRRAADPVKAAQDPQMVFYVFPLTMGNRWGAIYWYWIPT